jgi:nucleoside-diphosphate-sugar epimerase
MHLLLTGSAGYVGSKLYQRLIDAGHTVDGVDTCWFSDGHHGIIKADIRKWRPERDYDAIFLLAAIANDPSVQFYCRRSWETGVMATQQIAQWAARMGIRIIYASSVSVYGADRGLVTEEQDVFPLTDYNSTKIAAERVLLSYPEIRPQIIRPATICGLSPRMRLDLTVNMFTMQALTKGTITVHGGQQWRPSIHIDDMCDLYLWMLERPGLTGVWNAGFENHSLIEIANTIADYTDAEVTITEQRDQRSYKVNSDKLLAAGFEPRKRIANAIQEIIVAYSSGELKDLPQHYNLGWMQTLGVKDE